MVFKLVLKDLDNLKALRDSAERCGTNAPLASLYTLDRGALVPHCSAESRKAFKFSSAFATNLDAINATSTKVLVTASTSDDILILSTYHLD